MRKKIENLGMKFGLWFEPEMVNKDSGLYREHPDWILHVPGRSSSHGRYQYVLDYSRPEVVSRIYEMMSEILRESRISYIKWPLQGTPYRHTPQRKAKSIRLPAPYNGQ